MSDIKVMNFRNDLFDFENIQDIEDFCQKQKIAGILNSLSQNTDLVWLLVAQDSFHAIIVYN